MSTALVITIYNLPSRLIHESSTPINFLQHEQGIGLYLHLFICEYIWYFKYVLENATIETSVQ